MTRHFSPPQLAATTPVAFAPEHGSTADLPRLAVVEVTRHRPDRPAYHAKVQVLNASAVSAGERGGWRVTRLAAADMTPAELLEATDDCDAILIMGGEDITPRFYGGADGYEGETRHYDAADEGQIALVHRAVARDTPLLGICRGLQVINVALGGGIVQHIEDGIHRTVDVPVDQTLREHPVELLDGTGLLDSLGSVAVSVQSAHHQSVGRLGAGLVPAAIAPDGLVEAVEHESAPITGVQWHPEAPDAPAEQLPLLLSALQRQVADARVADLVAA
ncbi:gamma-glutamyl-gamma-aminobutyrate hydrolase family protein [Cryobacterium fucosi]|uniref:Gamma-glutamyl-gamma-aminobutyrate hydrolase family protein n=1 Tax=Cryobacterium fucosi TaxID=1259157 RepID=A0A4V3IVY6_9MICO|nr:gamma-glutamyl-gamma-aminobutyrate hydrolase family protein [Cryobacterium fucosi]TFD81165.1 gamma-glutamyl-gamma-aminobutyrate hydrolase family protein [Cryobacterium fucosi]